MLQAATANEQVAGMPRDFWENELEMPLEYIMRQINDPDYLPNWIAKRTGRQLSVLCEAHGMDSNGSAQKKKKAVAQCDSDLQPYILADRFASKKSRVAVADYAERVLPGDMLEACRQNEEEFDTTALLLAIFARQRSDLRLVYHLDKIHKTGFARMRLGGQARQPDRTFEAFLRDEPLDTILAEYDQGRTDGLTSELKDVIDHHGRHLVFIRRGERPDHLVSRTGDVIHGYKSEWIILDFEKNAKRVNISSVSPAVPLEIANRIATAYFGKTCEYTNECVITYPKQIERFLAQVKDVQQGELVLVEVVAQNSPLDGSPKIMLSDSVSIGRAISHLEAVAGTFLADIDNLDSIKVLYRKKRVSLIFEKDGGGEGYVVRYSDHRLNALQRPLFEQHMEEVHGITVLSTEKRFKKPA